MKKHEIRKRIAAAVDKHIPDVIKHVARGKAYDQVHDALRNDPDAAADGEISDAQPVRAAPMPSAPMTPADHAAARTRKS